MADKLNKMVGINCVDDGSKNRKFSQFFRRNGSDMVVILWAFLAALAIGAAFVRVFL